MSPTALPSSNNSPPSYPDNEKALGSSADKTAVGIDSPAGRRDSLTGSTQFDSTHRQLKSRHIQLIGIGGTIGTVLYVCALSLFYIVLLLPY